MTSPPPNRRAVLHTRQAARDDAARLTRAALEGPATRAVQVIVGKEVVEMAVLEVTKGDALVRLREETGADVVPQPLGYRHGFAVEPELAGRFGGGLVTVDETAFVARVPAEFGCVRSDEHAEHEWLSVADALGRLRYAGLRRAVSLAAKTLSGLPAEV